MTQGVRGEDLRRRGERGRHWEEEAMAGLSWCVYMVVWKASPGPSRVASPKEKTGPPHRTTAPRRTTARRSCSLAVNFGRKLSARAPTLFHAHPPTPVWSRPSLSIAPGTAPHSSLLLSGSAKACGAIWKLGPHVDQSGAGKKLMGSSTC